MRRKRRKRLWWAAAAGGVLVAGVLLVRALLGALPAAAVARLEQVFPFRAEIEAATFSWPGTVRLRNVRLRRKSDGSEVARIRRIDIEYTPAQLLTGARRQRGITVHGALLSVRNSDLDAFEGRSPGRLPDYPIRIDSLSARFWKTGRAGEKPWLRLSSVNLLLAPRTAGCLAVKADGTSAALGPVEINGILGGDFLDSRLVVTCRSVPLTRRLLRLVPEDVAGVWDELRPAGRASLEARFSWPRKAGLTTRNLDVSWRLSLTDATVRVKKLPQPIRGVNGLVEGTQERVVVRRLAGNYGAALLTCRGHTLRRGEKMYFRLHAGARDLEPTEEVTGLLPASVRSSLRRIGLRGGKVDGDVELRFILAGGGSGHDWTDPDFLRADITLRDASVRPEWFPYRLDKVTTRVRVGLHDLVFTTPMVAWHGRGSVKLSGSVGFDKTRPESEVLIEADDLAIDRDLHRAIEAVGGDVYHAWKQLALDGGKLALTLNLKGPFGRDYGDLDPFPEWSLEVGLEGASATYTDFPYQLTGLAGTARIGPNRVTLEHITGWHGEAAFQISGWIEHRTDGRKLRIQVHGTNVKLDDDLARALDDETRRQWREYQPAGTVDVDALLSTPTRKGRECDVRLGILMKHCSVRLPVGGRRLPLHDMTGRVELFGDVLRFAGVRARCLGGEARIDGVLVRTKELMKLQANLSGDNFSVGELVALLPKETAKRAALLRPAGTLKIRKARVDIIRRPGAEPDVEYACSVDVRDARVAVPMSGAAGAAGNPRPGRFVLSDISGRITFSDERDRVPVGSFELDKVQLLHGTVRNVVGRIRRIGPLFALEGVRGDIYGGLVEASFRGSFDLPFSGWVRASGLDVARLCRETGITTERVWGDLRATVQVNGERVDRGGQPGWRLSGSGTVNIDRGNLGRTPLVRSLLDVKSLFLSRHSIISTASASFEIAPAKLVVDRLVLSGPTLSTRGFGTIGYEPDPAIDLYFYRKTKAGILPDLPVIQLVGDALSWVADLIQNQIVVVHLGGTLRDPEASPVVFKDLADQLRRLIIVDVLDEETEKAEGASNRKAGGKD